MVLVTYWHALRVSEVINLRGRNIQHGMVHVQRLKGSTETVQPYVWHPDPELCESHQLEWLAEITPPKARVFPITRFGYYKLMREAGEKANIPYYKKVRPHILKHTIITHILPAGIDYTREWAGHKSISSTGEYVRRTQEETGLVITDFITSKM